MNLQFFHIFSLLTILNSRKSVEIQAVPGIQGLHEVRFASHRLHLP